MQTAEIHQLRDLKVMALAASINRKFGGSLRNVLRSLISGIRSRENAARELRATSAGSWPWASRGKSASGMGRSEEHTSELQSLMRISYAVFCLKKKKKYKHKNSANINNKTTDNIQYTKINKNKAAQKFTKTHINNRSQITKHNIHYMQPLVH